MAKKLYDMTNEPDEPDDDVLVNMAGEEGLDVVVEDDTPEKDRGRKPYVGPDANPTDDEIGAYTQGVQDRIRKMRHQFHDERRAKEDALRQSEQAIEFAKRLLEERKRLTKALEDGHTVLKDTTTKSAENEIATTRSALSQAIAAGDNEKIAELNAQLARAAARAEAAGHMAPIKFEDVKIPEIKQRPRVQLTPTAQEWMDKNPWFQTDDRMTAIAMAAHDRLIKSGVRYSRTSSRKCSRK
jgi:septal ring factor EnvC (AmiA/AmiB activator)